MNFTVYLIHFDQKYHHARHYIGYTCNLSARLERHRTNKGGRLLEVINQAGIPWEVVRTWECNQDFESRELEKKLKSWHNSKKFCPKCNPNALQCAIYNGVQSDSDEIPF